MDGWMRWTLCSFEFLGVELSVRLVVSDHDIVPSL